MPTPTEARSRAEKLRKEISRHRYLYHVLDRQEISDEALDSLKHELARLEEAFPELITPDSPTQRVAGRPLPGFKKVRHETPMLSLSDVFSEAELRSWEERIAKLAGSRPIDYFAELKVDGFAVSLIYKNGGLTTGSTRGDGVTGEDVTENLKTVESIPLRLHDPLEFEAEPKIRALLKKFPRVRRAVSRIPATLEVRGEVYMTKRAFDTLNRAQKKQGLPEYANPRNVASGSIRQLDPKIARSRALEFHAYDLVTDLGQATHEEEHAIAALFGFRTVELSRRCANLNDVIAFWKTVEEKRESLPYLIDGIVVQVNDSDAFTGLGVAGKAPRGAAAFKFSPKQATTVIEDIILQVGRTGVLTPVAVLRPVELGGVTVRRATLHNLDEIRRLDAQIGDTAVVERAGDVIPAIVGVLKNLRPRGARAFAMPRSFCKQRVIRRPGEVAHRIEYPDRCGASRRAAFRHFVRRNAFDIVGLGPKIIDRLVDAGLVATPADLFRISADDLVGLDGFQKKSAEKLAAAIGAKRKISLARLIIALGIPHVGEETALDVARRFATVEALMRAPQDDLARIPNIGPIVGASIYRWFRTPANRALIADLGRAGVSIEQERRERAAQKLAGKMFVLTGTLETMARDEAKEKVRALGGSVSESVGAKTSYVVAGASPGSKLAEARRRGIRIINEKEFIQLIR